MKSSGGNPGGLKNHKARIIKAQLNIFLMAVILIAHQPNLFSIQLANITAVTIPPNQNQYLTFNI